ncbi:MAG: signal peptide peptidase SppA [Caulobacterales bacterium]
MKQFLITLGGVFAGLLLFFVGIPIILIASLSGKSDEHEGMPKEIVLSIDLRGNVPDQPPTNPFASMDGAPSVVSIVETLEKAEKDDRVKGLYVRGNDEGVSPAAAQEIRDAFNHFRKAGKFVIAHMQNEMGGGVSSYALLAGADEIWMQSASDFQATGVGTETMFLGGAFEKFSMQPQFEQFYEYKNAANVYTQKTYTAAHRESTTSLLQGLYTDLTADIAAGRKTNPDAIKAIMEAGPYTGAEAQQKKLVDKLGRPADAEKAALDRAGKDSGLVEFADYAASKSDKTSGPAVALVMGEGAIVTGKDEAQPFSSEATFASDTISDALLDAAKDDDVKAIVFRVSSPGGSAVASDQVWDAVEKVKAAGKPVVVSMGAYAASGGYYVSTGADKIVAWPATITGSIGVLGGKVVVGGAIKKYLGANSEAIIVGGPNTGANSASTPFTNYQRAQFHRLMANIYEDFTGKVAVGRKLPIERVKQIAKGRVWTGTQARSIGLVDEFGGLRTALALARSMGKLKDNARVIHYPAAKSPFELIEDFFGVSGEAARAMSTMSLLLGDERIRATARALQDQRAGIRTEMSPVEVR